MERVLKWRELKRLEYVGFNSVMYGSKFKTRKTLQNEGGVEKVFYHIEGDNREFTDFDTFVCHVVEFWRGRYLTLSRLVEDRKGDKEKDHAH